jgi:hypothetical protein
MDCPAILRRKIELELLIMVVGGAVYFFYCQTIFWTDMYGFTSCRQHSTYCRLNTVDGARRGCLLVPFQGETQQNLQKNVTNLGGSEHTTADKCGEVTAKGDFCTKRFPPPY